MAQTKITPMITQYLEIKERYAEYILFYRMGDFYEMFFDDAKIASRELEITLTTRNKHEKAAVPMCGVPVKSAEGYIGRLIEKGYKVAICDQTEDPAEAKGLVKRDVVRVVTPGMIINDALLDEKTNNFVIALWFGEKVNGIASLDVSTGAFHLAESANQSAVLEEALRIAPSEIVMPEAARENPVYSNIFHSFEGTAITFLEDSVFDVKNARDRLIGQFHTKSLEGFGCERASAGIGAAGALLYYLRDTQKQDISHLSGIETYHLDRYLFIDDISCRNLELLQNLRTGAKKGTLLEVIDATMTAMGGRLLRQWLRYPLQDAADIRARLDAVEEAKNQLSLRKSIRDNLRSVADLERLGGKIAMGHANARDLLALKRSLTMLPVINEDLNPLTAELYQWEDALLGPLGEVAELIENAIETDPPPTLNEGGIIKRGYNSDLDELIRISTEGKSYLAELAGKERERTGIQSLKVSYNKVFGYYIEVSKSRSESVPAHYIRKQTLVNAERYITEELKDFESKVLGAQEKRVALEYELFRDIRQRVADRHAAIASAARFIARLDCLLNLAEIADMNHYVRPTINEDGAIDIADGRHPVVEKLVAGERFVANTITMDNEATQIMIITGPNMAGKSTVLRQVALIVLMAHMGSFVPAASAAISVTDRIFTRVGALDNLAQGQSTFLVEMEETANIINNATPKSLVVMDEIGRGTSTYDGLSIAWAVAEHLHDLRGRGVKTLFATHYHELTELPRIKPRVKNFNISVKEWNDEIIFLHKIVEGATNRSYGIQVARLAGISEKVVRRSKKILSNVENTGYPLGKSPQADTDEPSSGEGYVQLSLFRPPEQVILDKLREIDISSMTPMDAINYLHMLKETANHSGDGEKHGKSDVR
ncbi:MAG: DNA mismatch repair protein MutS [Desulfobacterales bacterium]|nr:DNA mismatch repair protein MutS [Desulfobacterales bacterium]